MSVDIYIIECDHPYTKIRIPWLPDKINMASGKTTMASYDILGKGKVEVPTGVDPSSWSWESIFPGPLRTDTSMLRGRKANPNFFHSTFERWKKNKQKLVLRIDSYSINKNVYIEDYTAYAAGAFGDIEYSISFKEAGVIKVTSTTKGSKETKTEKRDTNSAKKNTYTVKKGDTLWAIANKFFGDGRMWIYIYEKNKIVIEKVAKKRGKSSSGYGHWIYPGTKLEL